MPRDKLPYMQWFVNDWMADPAVGDLTEGARGAWFDLINVMWMKGQIGSLTATVTKLAGWARVKDPQAMLGYLFELQGERHGDGAADLEPRVSAIETTDVTRLVLTISNRRMRDDHERRKSWSDRQKKTRKKKKDDADRQSVTPLSRGLDPVESPDLYIPEARVQSPDPPTPPTRESQPETEYDRQLKRAQQVLRLWNVLPGAALLPNPHAVIPLAAAIDDTRQAAKEAGKPFPSDADLLGAIVREAQRMNAAGLSNVWQPKTLARGIGAALKALEKQDAGSPADAPEQDEFPVAPWERKKGQGL